MTILDEVSDQMTIIKKQSTNCETYDQMIRLLNPPPQLDLKAYRRMLVELSAKAALAADMVHSLQIGSAQIDLVTKAPDLCAEQGTQR